MFKQLKYFQSVVRLNSFSEAAEGNYISQSAISQQIQALERELGVKLLNRDRRKFSLTPAGEHFYRKSLILIHDFDRLCEETKLLDQGIKQVFTVGYPRQYHGTELQQIIPEFRQKYPHLPLYLVSGTHDDLYNLLREGKADLVFNDLRRQPADKYVNQFLIQEKVYVELPETSYLGQLSDITMDDLKNAIIHIRDTYGKKVYVAENAYCYTSEDGDGSANSIKGTDDLAEGYSASVQGQANEVRDVCAAASEAGAEGIFYWEGTWIPVGPADADNSAIWEKYGSGWASSYAGGYDPKDAGQYYGGSSWDNQAMFDFTGHPLASLNIFKYLKYGATAPLAIDTIPEIVVSCNIGAEVKLPDTVSIIYNDRSEEQVPVTWDAEDIAAIDTENGGEFTVAGSLDEGTEVTAIVTVERVNYVQNPGFEDADTSMWTVTYSGETNPTDYQVKAADAHSGEVAFHFWSGTSDMDFSIEQSFTDLEPGTYELSAFSQGGDLAADASMELYAVVDGKELTVPFMLTTYADWQNPTVSGIKVTDGTLTIGVRYQCNKNSWGTLDDVTLHRVGN